MKEIFPWFFATALLLAGSAFLYAGVKLTSTAWTLKTSGEQTTATIERVEVREAHVRKDDAPAIVHYYTEVVSFTARDGSKVEARLPRRTMTRHAAAPATRSRSATATTIPRWLLPSMAARSAFRGRSSSSRVWRFSPSARAGRS